MVTPPRSLTRLLLQSFALLSILTLALGSGFSAPTRDAPGALPADDPAAAELDALGAPAEGGAAPMASIAERTESAPLLFIENVGQFDAGARFQVRGALGGAVWLADDGLWVTLFEAGERERGGEGERETSGRSGERCPPVPHSPCPPLSPSPKRGVNLRLTFVGANPRAAIEPLERLETRVSYFIGADAAGWHPDVPVWGGVRYRDLYPGVDLELTGAGGRWQQRLVARPGTDLSAVRLRVDGADQLTLLPSPVSGEGPGVRVVTAAGELTLPLFRVDGAASLPHPALDGKVVDAPFAVDALNGERSTFNAEGSSDLVYSTFLGGSDWDSAYAVTLDRAGTAYVTGSTSSADFPVTPGAFDTTYNGSDAFVAKLNAAGSGLIYSTFLGGNKGEGGSGLALDADGAAYVTGYTDSTDFPTTPGAFDTSLGGGDCYGSPCPDAFAAKLDPAGSSLAYATFLGGQKDDVGYGLAVGGGGTAYVTGHTSSADFPTTPGAFDTSCNGDYCGDIFVAKLDAAGSSLAYATFLGGQKDDSGYGLAVGGDGAAYVTGYTYSADFPATPGAFDTSLGGGDCYGSPCPDAFAAKLDPAGSSLAYATFLGGQKDDVGYGLAVGGGGTAYVTGHTSSADFPTTPGAFDTSCNGDYCGDIFVAKLDAAGSSLAYATFLGGQKDDIGYGLAVGGDGAAYVTGYTYSADFPVTPGAFDQSCGSCDGGSDAFVAKLDPAGSGLAYATFLGGKVHDYGYGIAVYGGGAAYVTGATSSWDFPITPGAFDTSCGGCDGRGSEPFVSKLQLGPPDLIFADGFESGDLAAWTKAVTDGGDLRASPAAALVGEWGMQATLDDRKALFVADESPEAEARYRARFHFDPNAISMGNGNAHFVLVGFSGNAPVLAVEFRYANARYQLRALLRTDTGGWRPTGWAPLSDAPHAVELDWRAASGAGANDGGLTLWLDGAQRADLTGVDNDGQRLDAVRWGAVAGVDGATRGTLYFDAFESRRYSYIGP